MPDLAALATQNALDNSSVDAEELDYIILAHNFGNLNLEDNRIDMMPSLAARVKHKLGITNPTSTC